MRASTSRSPSNQLHPSTASGYKPRTSQSPLNAYTGNNVVYQAQNEYYTTTGNAGTPSTNTNVAYSYSHGGQQLSGFRQQPSQHLEMQGSPSISFGKTTDSNSNIANNNFVSSPPARLQSVNLPNGDTYQGEINQKGKFHGKGSYRYAKQGYEYRGDFRNGRPEGRGNLYKVGGNGDILIYEGQWQSGMKNGKGKYYYGGNMYFDGNWNNDHKQLGVFKCKSGKFQGIINGNSVNGRGEFHNQQTNTTFRGQFQNGELISGNIIYPNKDEYIGKLQNGKRHDTNGRYVSRGSSPNLQYKYAGGWLNDQRHSAPNSGPSVVTFENGESIKGQFENGRFKIPGQCEYQWIDGSSFRGWVSQGPNSLALKGVVTQANNSQFYQV